MAGQPPVSAVSCPHLHLEEGGLVAIRFDDPHRSANILTQEVMTRLGAIVDHLEDLARQGSITGVVVESGKPDSFILGADVEAIAAIPGLHELNIGHAIIARALFVGLKEAVAEMKRLAIAGQEAGFVASLEALDHDHEHDNDRHH